MCVKSTCTVSTCSQIKGFKVYSSPWGGGVLPCSLGGDVPLGSQKSYPLLDQILQILWPYTRLKMLNCSWFQSFVSDPIKPDPILD